MGRIPRSCLLSSPPSGVGHLLWQSPRSIGKNAGSFAAGAVGLTRKPKRITSHTRRQSILPYRKTKGMFSSRRHLEWYCTVLRQDFYLNSLAYLWLKSLRSENIQNALYLNGFFFSLPPNNMRQCRRIHPHRYSSSLTRFRSKWFVEDIKSLADDLKMSWKRRFYRFDNNLRWNQVQRAQDHSMPTISCLSICLYWKFYGKASHISNLIFYLFVYSWS